MRLTWNIYKGVTKQVAVTWNVPVTRVASTKAMAWNVYNKVSAIKQSTWSDVGRINNTWSVKYNCLVGASSTTVVEWVVGDPNQTQIIQTAMDRTDFAY